MVGDNRQGYAILGVMATIFLVSRHRRCRCSRPSGQGTAPQLAGGAMEGKEQRFGILGSTLFARRHHADLDRRRQLDARLATRRSAA